MSIEQEKKELFRRIQAAVLIELSTIPPYMVALLSIQPGKNREAANLIRGVMMEEMLHLSLAGNLMSAVGGRVRFTAENIPSYPLILKFDGKGFKDREFEVDLAAFSPESIDSFLQIELPEGWRDEHRPLRARAEVTVHGYTLGEYYEKILRRLGRLCAEYGEAAVFSGDPTRQLNLNHYWAGGGKPIVIRDLDSATAAIRLIITQGEGTPGSVYDGDRAYFDQPRDVAHFFRFREIYFARRYLPHDRPRLPPTGPEFTVDYSAVQPIIRNPTQADYANDPVMGDLNRRFNRLYTLMLKQIAEALNGVPDAMYTAILNSMHEMTSVAQHMMSQPIAGDPQKRHGAPSFDWSEEAPARKPAPAPGPVALTSTWYLVQGCPPELADALRKLPDKVKAAEPETLTYVVHLNANAPLNRQAEPVEPPPAPIPLEQQVSVTFYEVYATPEAFSRHVLGEVFQTFKAKFLHCFQQDPKHSGWPITHNATFQRLAGFSR